MFIVATTRLQVQVILPIKKKKKKKNDMIGFGRKFLINYNLSCRLAIQKQNMKSMVEASAVQIPSSKGCIEEETYCYLNRFSMYLSLNKHLWQSRHSLLTCPILLLVSPECAHFVGKNSQWRV